MCLKRTQHMSSDGFIPSPRTDPGCQEIQCQPECTARVGGFDQETKSVHMYMCINTESPAFLGHLLRLVCKHLSGEEQRPTMHQISIFVAVSQLAMHVQVLHSNRHTSTTSRLISPHSPLLRHQSQQSRPCLQDRLEGNQSLDILSSLSAAAPVR